MGNIKRLGHLSISLAATEPKAATITKKSEKDE